MFILKIKIILKLVMDNTDKLFLKEKALSSIEVLLRTPLGKCVLSTNTDIFLLHAALFVSVWIFNPSSERNADARKKLRTVICFS